MLATARGSGSKTSEAVWVSIDGGVGVALLLLLSVVVVVIIFRQELDDGATAGRAA